MYKKPLEQLEDSCQDSLEESSDPEDSDDRLFASEKPKKPSKTKIEEKEQKDLKKSEELLNRLKGKLKTNFNTTLQGII